MDRAGVDMQVLSAAPQLPYGADLQQAQAAARFVNDQYAELVSKHPDRFRAFAATPMPHVGESIAEMGRALDELGMTGVVMNTTVLDQALADPRFEPVFAELNRRQAVLYLHPAGNSACTPLIKDFSLTWMVGAPVEDTISVMQLITRGIPSRYPDIKIINSHLGGALPMLLQRADNQYKWEYPETPELPSAAARRMWYDTVGHGHIPALRCTVDSFGADRHGEDHQWHAARPDRALGCADGRRGGRAGSGARSAAVHRDPWGRAALAVGRRRQRRSGCVLRRGGQAGRGLHRGHLRAAGVCP
jgi:6-methylsalicylate decarboxylase